MNKKYTRLIAAIVFVAAASAIAASVARSGSPPVGPLPAGHVSTIKTTHGDLVAIALPARGGGKVWRVARTYDGSVVKELREANVGASVVIVLAARGVGHTRVAYALTRGERSTAYEARIFDITVR